MFYTWSHPPLPLQKLLMWCVYGSQCPTNIRSQKRKFWVIFLFVKTPNRGEGGRGGAEGGLANHQTFYLIFFVKPSLKDTTFAIFLKSIRVIDIKYDIHVYSRMSIIIIMDVNHNHHIITNTKCTTFLCTSLHFSAFLCIYLHFSRQHCSLIANTVSHCPLTLAIYRVSQKKSVF